MSFLGNKLRRLMNQKKWGFIMFSSWIEIVVLVIALSIDAFVASFVYGSNKVRIPLVSAWIITMLSTGILILFLVMGNIVGAVFPSSLTKGVCFLILFSLGIIKFLDTSLKSWIRCQKGKQKKWAFSISGLQFILTVYANPETANAGDITVLSPAEAVSLGIALSLDSAAAGIGAGMMVDHYVLTAIISCIVGIIAIIFGCWFGNRIASHSTLDLSWLSSILLMILAFMKLI